jgi:hypothetical protein
MLRYSMDSLIPFFKEKQLKPAWNFDAGILIWRVFFTSTNLLIGETRNQETKSTSFFCLDLHTGKPLWHTISFDEPWWIGIETVYERWMILHGFVRPDMPEHRGIRAVDIHSGKLLWRNEDLSFWFMDNEKLYAHKYLFEKHIGCELDIATGTIVNEYSDNLDPLLELRQKVLQQESEHHQDVLFPEVYEENEADPKIMAIVQRMTEGKALVGWIEYISYNGILIVSQYRRVQNQSETPVLNNHLSVYDIKAEKILYSDIIAHGVKTPSQDSFFIKDGFLLFIRHQTIVSALKPWKS